MALQRLLPKPADASLIGSPAAILLGLMLPAVLWAQDNNARDCAANANSDGEMEVCRTTDAIRLDWVPIEQVPPELQDRQCRNCQGRYIDPLAGEATDEPPEEAEINARADSTELIEGQAVFTGSVQAQQGYRRLYGDSATVYRERESAVLTGNVTLREPGILLTGKRAEIFSATGEARVQSGEFVFHERHMRGAAHYLERDAEGFVHIHDGSFSYCAPGEDDWVLRAEKLTLDFDEGLATAKDAKIDFEGVPIFYTPWIQFPLDDRRRTGFLWPHFGNDSTGGLDITVPYYINLAPNYDALYSPRWIEERGVNHVLTTRYLNPAVGSWEVGGSWLPDDDKYGDQISDDKSTDRWIAIVRQNGLFNERWRSRVDYSKASDVDYLEDLDTSSLESQRKTSLLQLARMDYLGDNWLVNIQARQFQSLANDINDDYKTLPEVTAQYWGSTRAFQWQPLFLSQISNFDSDDDRVTGQRLYAEAGVSYPMRWLAGSLEPTLKYRYVDYALSDHEDFPDDGPSAGTAVASLDGRLVFERQTSVGEKSLLQTLEPRLYYLYSEYEDQSDQPDFDSAELTFSYNQLFRETRFAGKDRLDDANQVAVGLTTNFVDNQSGRNLLSASIGQIYYFRDRKVRLENNASVLDDSGSEIAGELTFAPNDKVKLRSSLVYDPFEGNVNSGHFHTGYFADNGAIYNVGYSFRRPLTSVATATEQPSTEEASFSAYLPVSTNWSLFGAMNYSTQANRSVEDMAGVEYDSCCWTVRLLYLRYYDNESDSFTDFDDPNLERESTVQFQILLKGMGGFGDRITDIMQDMIRGFSQSDY